MIKLSVFVKSLLIPGALFLWLPSCQQSGEDKPEIAVQTVDPLPSWNEGENKKAILSFVKAATDSADKGYIPEADRIACFDNDGTLWTEQPMYFQLAFAFDEIKRRAPEHPDWKNKQPFKGVIEGDAKAIKAAGEKGLMSIVAASHSGVTAAGFDSSVVQWLATAKHPKTGTPYRDMVFQPMLELLAYLRLNGFRTFIVSGGGIDFMRAFAQEVYGVPPYQVVGSIGAYQYRFIDGRGQLVKIPGADFVDDKAGKPVGIHRAIGKIPVFAAGNSDGDFEMLQYTTTSPGSRLGIIIHHTDSVREFAYDREGHIGVLRKGLDSAAWHGWKVVDMKNDWKTIYHK